MKRRVAFALEQGFVRLQNLNEVCFPCDGTKLWIDVMNFICPRCKLKLKCEDEFAGQVVHCPNCDCKLRVPAPKGIDPSRTKEKKETAEAPPEDGSSHASGGAVGKKETPGSGGWQPTDSSNVSIWLSFALGLLFMAAFYLLSLPIRKSYFGALFWDRGWVPFVLVLFMGWCMAILGLKLRKLRAQKRAMFLDVLPDSISNEITIHNVGEFLRNIDELPGNLQQCLLVKRMRLGLHHFQVRHSNPEVANMMMSQSEIDAGTINSSFSLLKVFLWAIPILGFIGTVIGISGAVGGFSGSLEAAQDIAVLKESLNGVTSGLAVAFDTTLVALVMSLFISFPLNAVQKAEEDLLGWVDAYCNENLLKRLNDSGGMPGGGGNAEDAIQAISQSLLQSQGAILREFRSVQEAMGETQKAQAQTVENMSTAIDRQLTGMQERAEAHQKQLESTLVAIVTHVGEAMKDIRENGVAVEAAAGKLISASTSSVKTHIAALAEGMSRLNEVLRELGSRQVVIQQNVSRTWWPFRSGKK